MRKTNLSLHARLSCCNLEQRLTPATYFVSNATDSGPGSFRQAILDANQDSFLDTISFADNVFSTPQTITVQSELPPILRPVTVIGTGADKCIVDANNAFTILRIVHVFSEPAMAVSITGVTFQNGKNAANVGGLSLGSDSITLQSCRILNSSGEAGGVYCGGTKLTLIDTTVAGNTSTFYSGGGIYAVLGSVIVAQRSTFSGNTSGSAGAGGIYTNGGSLTLDDCTISGNKTTSNGGGIIASGNIALRHCTVTNNSAATDGGLRLNGITTLTNTIVAGNTASSIPDIRQIGTLTLDHCAIGNSSGLGTYTDKGGNLLNAAVNLAGLAVNGGLTATHALKAGSAARDAAASLPGFVADQRGETFFGPPDIGAFEVVPPTAKIDPVVNVFAANQAVPIVVHYSDELAMSLASLGLGDILVTGPNGYSTMAKFVSVAPTAGNKFVDVQYQLDPPSGGWKGINNGTYSVNLVANEAKDVHDWAATATTLASFSVSVSQTLTVTNTADAGPGSLRQAVLDSEVGGAADVINFAANVTGTILLTSGELAFNEQLTINGPGTAKLAISGNSASRIFNHQAGAGPASFSITGLTLTKASANGPGGAILMGNQSLTLTNCNLLDNTTETYQGPGGAIAFIGAAGGALTITSCNINNNYGDAGGAIYLDAPSMITSIAKSNFVGNSALTGGGAIYVYNGGGLTVTDSTFSGNSTIGGSTRGGGIYFYGKATQLRILNCTLSGNSAKGSGGAIFLNNTIGAIEIFNSTIKANSANTGSGGGVARSNGDAIIILESSIVSNNTANTSTGFDIASDGEVRARRSALGSTNGIAFYVDEGDNLPVGSDLKLGPLADNGGATWTHALLANSPAINKGSNPANVLLDQRGVPFVRLFGGRADIGAYESQAAPRVTSVRINDNAVQRSLVTKLTVSFSDPITFTPNAGAAFVLTRTGPTGTTGTVNLVAVQSDSRNVVLTFAAGGQVGIDAGKSLLDGTYQLTVLASNTAGAGGQLDGNANGIGGDNYLSLTTGAGRLFRLFGDADADGDCDNSDFVAFRAAIGNGPSIFDIDGDGDTDNADFVAFRGRFGTTVP